MPYEFRTKLGTCTLDSEKMVLSRQGVTGKFADKSYGQSIGRLFIIYTVLILVLWGFAINSFLHEEYVYGAFMVILGAWLFYGVITSRNNSATNMIERSEVEKITVHKPRPGLTRGYFIVHFFRDGKRKKRMVMLPGTLSGGSEEFTHAQEVLRESGWDEFVRE